MLQTLYTGVTSLLAQQVGIDVTSNNLANVDSTGFKGNTIEFKSLFETALSSASSRSSVDSTVGIGTAIMATPTNLKTGDITNTDSSTDLSIGGNGWFGIQGNGETMYTRNGIFNFDKDRSLVNASGNYVLGTLASNFNSNNVLTSMQTSTNLGAVGSQGPIKLPVTLTYPAQATTKASFSGNLGINNTPMHMGATIIDANGNKNDLSLTFTQTVPQPSSGISWDVKATVSSPPAYVGGPTTTYDTQSGVITFDTAGALLTSTLGSVNNNGSPVSVNFGTGYTGLTSNSSDITSASQADGLVSGSLLGYKIDQNANVVATFSNGKQVSMAKIAVYHFQNDQGLNTLDGTNFTQSPNSGKPFFYQDAQGNNINGSTVLTNTLENSNVDPTAGLTDLIVYQRAYDAASKLVTTGDQMIQKALQLHR